MHLRVGLSYISSCSPRPSYDEESAIKLGATIRSHGIILSAGACTHAADEPAQRRRQGRLQRLRDMAAKGIRNLAEITADHISRCHSLCTACSALICVERQDTASCHTMCCFLSHTCGYPAAGCSYGCEWRSIHWRGQFVHGCRRPQTIGCGLALSRPPSSRRMRPQSSMMM